MNPQLRAVLKFLEGQYDLMVTSSIQRSEKGKKLDFHFSITAEQLKEGAGRDRLRQAVIDYAVEFFERMNATFVKWDERNQIFYIHINLIKASFTPSQARLLTENWSKA